MTRSLRIEFPGAVYHITSRGNAKKNIFRTDKDRNQFLFFLVKIMKKRNWRCHAYCLMSNHYHLVIETIDPTLSKGMQDLNGNYTQWFNAEHDIVGHIFQGRFKAFLIEEHFYLLNVVRYVVLNPIRANMTSDPADYPWSSYRATVGIEKAPPWLATKKILEQFSHKKSQAKQQYKKFVLDGIGLPSPMDEASKGGILGSTQFVDEIRDKVGAKISEQDDDIILAQRLVGRPTLVQVFDGVKNREERDAAIMLALNHLLYSSVVVGRFLHLHSSTVRGIAKGKK